MHTSADCATGKVPTKRLELALPQPDPDGLKLEVETKVEESNARIGLRVKTGEVGLDGVLKGEAKAPATIEIVDLNGNTVVSEEGDLEKFGFT